MASMRRFTAFSAAAVCLLAAGRAGRGDTGPGCPPGGTLLTWEGFGVDFFDTHCNRCHKYESYATVYTLRAEILALVLDGNMPPLTRLPDDEKNRLGEWISCGLPRGGSTVPLRRGDANGDGTLDVSDGIVVLLYLFAEGPASCLDALDADGSLAIDVTDAIAVLSYLFLDGPAPAEPFRECGAVEGGLGCVAHGGCAGV
jgi:hypothetical protein